MATSVNKAGERHALSLISAGDYDMDSSWSFDAADGDKLLGDGGEDWGEYARWFLGEDTDATDKTKDRYKYPFGKGGKVYRRAVSAIRSRASQQGDTSVYDAAGRIMDAMDQKEGENEGDEGKQHARPPAARKGLFAPDRLFVRRMSLRMLPDSFNEAERTCDVVFTTGAAVRRRDWMTGQDYDEVLSCEPNAVRLERLNRGAPLMDAHDYYSGTKAILGAVVPGTARMESGEGRATVKFSRSDEGERACQDAKDGVLRFVSVGYETHKQEIDSTKSPEVRTATDWEPYEISAVPMPADPDAGFRSVRIPEGRASAATRKGSDMTTTAAAPAALDERAIAAHVSTGVATALKTERERADAIVTAGRKLGLDDAFVQQHVRDGTDIAKFRELAIEEASKREAPIASAGPWPASPAVLRNGKPRELEPGEMAGRMIRCAAAAKRSDMSTLEVATLWRDADLVNAVKQSRAMSVSLGATGGFMVPEDYSADIIEFLRPLAVVRTFGPTIFPMPNGNISVPRLSSGAQGGYVGENKDIKAQTPGTGQLKLSAKKLAALVPISNDLLRFSSPAADMVVRDDAVRALATAEDVGFIRGPGTQFSPKGMRNWAQPANIIPANATINLVNTIADLNKAVNALEGNNVRMIKPGWIFSARTKNYLYNVTNTNGAFVFREEMQTGKLQSFPYKWTNNVPNNLGTGGDESEIYLADFADCAIGEVPGLIIDVSMEATYTEDGTTLVSAFSQDQTVIRLIEEHDFGLRHDFSVAVLTGVKWQ